MRELINHHNLRYICSRIFLSYELLLLKKFCQNRQKKRIKVVFFTKSFEAGCLADAHETFDIPKILVLAKCKNSISEMLK